jgi:adenosine deaminase
LDLIKLKIDKPFEPLDLVGDLIKRVTRIFNSFDPINSNYKFNLGDISKLHLYNRNNHFQSNYFEEKFGEKMFKEIGNAHQILHKKDSLLLSLEKQNILELGLLENRLFFYDLSKNITDACINYKDLKEEVVPEFIFLDDVAPKKLEYWNKYYSLHNWFPNSDFYYSNDPDFLKHLFENDTNLDQQKANKFIFENTNPQFKDYPINKFKEPKNNPLFIGIDIDWNGEQYGFKLLKQFRKNVYLMNRPCFIFVFSRFEYPSTIRKAVASGALFYITKQNFIQLVSKVYSIIRRMEGTPTEIMESKYRTYENWHLLNKLEPTKIVQLKSEIIKGFSYNPDYKLHSEKRKHAWKWIQSLPKADLHCHIGSCLGPDLLPLTAVLVLSEKFISPRSVIRENLKLIIDFIFLLAKDLFLNNKNRVELRNHNLIEDFGFNNNEYFCVFELLIKECKLTENLIFPEVVLFNPKDTTIERIFPNIDYSKPYFKKREELRKAKVEYDDLILFFIILIYIKENGIQKDKLQDSIEESLKAVISQEHKKQIQIAKVDIGDFIRKISELIDFNDLSEDKSNSNNLLKHLQSSKGKSNSLFTYLRGCEYGGSAHLQTKASIALACYYIVHQYAIPDNIRYLTLRCAVDGYAKSGILTQDTAMQALLNGFDNAVRLTKQKIHVDLILTAKRHKSIREFEENVSLALQYRNGLNLPKGFKEDINDSYFSSKTKVVSFDLAGLEEGNRASKYLPQFLPLLKKCFPITIHAGEEDDHEAIWEAIYLVQSQRIGHGLTLRDNPDLIELVRDRHIAIELCPLSNILTRKDGTYKSLPLERRNDSREYKDPNNPEHCPEYIKSEYYPLRQYLMQNLDVTINTDNPFVSDSTLTEEYLIAANLAGGLTKWEILRLVKNSFRSAAIPKEQKKLLMNEIDDEIYNLLFE